MDFLAIVQPISWRSSNYWLNSRPNQVAPRIGICSSSAFICASRGFSTLMSANWPLMIVNVFFVDYGVWGAPCPSMVWPQRSCGNGRKWRATHAVGMVVGAAKNHMREAKPLMNIPQRAMHAQCETLMDINGFGGHSC